MKHAVLILLLLPACASATQDDPNAPNVVLHLAQYESAPNAYLYGGMVNVRFALSIANRTKDPVTLTRIEIRTVSSGAYTIRPTSTPVNVDVAPGQEKTIPLSLWANARGGHARRPGTGDDPCRGIHDRPLRRLRPPLHRILHRAVSYNPPPTTGRA